MTELTLSGTVVYGDEFEERAGYVIIEDGKLKEIGDGQIESAVEGIIIPSFVNAHTHIGDSVAKEPDFMPLEHLVGPGGYKHKILGETSHETLVFAMSDAIADIFATGTQMFADFREGGISGLRALGEAFDLAGGHEKLSIKSFGRPTAGMKELRITNYELRIGDDGSEMIGEAKRGDEDINGLFEAGDGIGLSSVADYPQADLKFLADDTKRRGKIFALHAGERNAEDISGALELEPDFIVHLIHASQQDFTRMHDLDIGAVVCIRSNLVTGMGLPPLPQMLESGLTVGVGTDNVMLNSPNMFSEQEFIAKIFRLDEREVLKMCTLNSAKILNEEKFMGSIEEGKKANLLVIRNDTPNMRNVRHSIRGVVRRATRDDIAAIVHEGAIVKLGC
ncbi:Cytosine/adenosine deaminase [Methanophagales archaeon]|nr:Cytosine/adenosine deaminase [Methanophagales archaeon]